MTTIKMNNRRIYTFDDNEKISCNRAEIKLAKDLKIGDCIGCGFVIEVK